MTSADKRRVRKALHGMDFPADKGQLLAYAEEREADPKSAQALRALPEGQYHSIDEVERHVPQRPAEHDPDE
ncbi:DUF2795 domain-containing protein [Salinactinospora qingdaonensis]|uniref:DUF2795 domain-containing protein n=1 Tax=Salinactinospora qingdaonensis TaxID=702744 RepID=A0ABP7G649_9ACTN